MSNANFPAKLLDDLETQNLQELEETKKKLCEIVTSTREPWVAYGLMDHFYQRRSVRIVDILLKTNPVNIFDRLLEWLKMPSHKLPGLSLLGHIIAKHPTWLYNIEKHNVFREIFKILKTERDVIALVSALLCIITLLAKIPFLVKNHLDELFSVFSSLAAWNNHKTAPSSSIRPANTDLLEHLQIGLYIYFQRLYGMFPCNFMDYLRREYTNSATATPAKGAIFTHTILPLLETVRMHPKLITETLESEISENPWRKVTPHDVITQCARLSVDSCDNHQSQALHHDQSSGGSCQHHSHVCPGVIHHQQQQQVLEITQTTRFSLKTFSEGDAPTGPGTFVPPSKMLEYWSPSHMSYLTSPLPPSLQTSAPPSVTSTGNLVQSSPANIQKPHALQMNQPFVGGLGGTSPPEAAVEATPETTPLNDILRTQKSYPPQNSSAVRAIGLGGSSQPSSPLKKTAFHYPGDKGAAGMEHAIQKVLKLHQLELSGTEQKPTSIPSSPLPIQHQMHGAVSGNVGGGGNVLAKAVEKLEYHQHHHQGHPKQKMEPELTKFELSQSPCNVGGLHMPNSRSIQEFKEISRHSEESSKDASPEETRSIEEGNDAAPSIQDSAWNSSGTYKHMLVELSKEAKKDGEVCEVKKLGIAPKEILDRIIESAVAKKNAQNSHNMEEYYKNHILLLGYQLDFERHQREMTAERNRRLFGHDKDYKILDLNNKTLQSQVHQLMGEVESLKSQLDQVHVNFDVERSELVAELSNWKQKFQSCQDEFKMLRCNLEQSELRLADMERVNKEKNYEMDRMKADLFDLQSERCELMHHAEMGQSYKEQLVNLQSELLLMGELHQQWENRLYDMEREHQREAEMEILRMAFDQEVEEHRANLLQKSSQLDLATAKWRDAEKKLATADNLLIEQKRILKLTKEENEERFKSLESKYETQKAIIMKMEEHLLELYKNPATCPPSELLRSEMVSSACSADHASPLSVSLASSDGLSTSLRSATEVKAAPTPSSSSGNVIAASISSHTLRADANKGQAFEEDHPK